MKITAIIIILFLCGLTIGAQTTAFSYQGRLTEAGNPVAGTRFFRFTLFDENGVAVPLATSDRTLIVANNVFVGDNTGGGGQTGGNNTFVGSSAGFANGSGSGNTYLGANTQATIGNNYTNTTVVGANAVVTQNNSLILGSINGVNNATSDTKVGIGTTAPKAKLDVTGGNILVGSPGQGIILKSPSGATCKLLSIDNAGAMALSAIACP